MTPDVSFAIIFRNEIRCLERCFKSILPLKELCSCEIVAADTGSDDGSREVAEKYADILIDFPWINDFAAARNAVIGRCTGRWIFSIDADEWLDDDVSVLARFVKRTDVPARIKAVALAERNYNTAELTSYAEFYPSRLLRTADEPHYVGAIHEVPTFGPDEKPYEMAMLKGATLHHDGYVMLNDGSEAGREKTRRNMIGIRKELEKEPDNLRTLMEFIDSGFGEADYSETLRHSISLIKQKALGWDRYGGQILRNAVSAAIKREMVELDEWIALAETLFPESYLIQIDVNRYLTERAVKMHNDDEAARRGEAFLHAWRQYHEDANPTTRTMNTMLLSAGDYYMHNMCILLTGVYTRLERYERAYAKLTDIDWGELTPEEMRDALRVLMRLFAVSELAFDALLREIWDGVNEERGGKEKAKKRKEAFMQTCANFFNAKELSGGDGKVELTDKQSWELFLPLTGRCILGDAAALMRCTTAEEAEQKLAAIDTLTELPARAFAYVMTLGCRFPLPGKSLRIEEFDTLALELAWEPDTLVRMAILATDMLPAEDAAEYPQTLLWAQSLVLCAVRKAGWKEAEEDGLRLARSFAGVERAFLPYCYTPAALDELCALPSMHRYGMFCVRAFDALDAGDYIGCIRALHDGIKHCGDVRPMVDYLLERVQKRAREEQIASAPPELRAMAEQVKALLAKFDPDSPEVKQLKESPAYQKVAYLIEG